MTDDTPQLLTAAEIASRRAALEQAEHSGEMEGQHITAATRADGDDWVTGRIDSHELIARIRARYWLD